jgi:hypothetical protein
MTARRGRVNPMQKIDGASMAPMSQALIAGLPFDSASLGYRGAFAMRIAA